MEKGKQKTLTIGRIKIQRRAGVLFLHKVNNKRGFTLIELIIVLFLISLSLSIIIGIQFKQRDSLRLKTTARKVYAFLQSTRSFAIVDGKRDTCFYYAEKNLLQENLRGKQMNLPPEVRIYNKSEESLKGKIPLVTFYPDGSAEGESIDIKINDKKISVIVDPLSGDVKVRPLQKPTINQHGWAKRSLATSPIRRLYEPEAPSRKYALPTYRLPGVVFSRQIMNNRGFTLLETLICVFIVGLCVTVFFQLLSGSMKLERKAQELGIVSIVARQQLNRLLAEDIRQGDFPWEGKVEGFPWELCMKPIDVEKPEGETDEINLKIPDELYQFVFTLHFGEHRTKKLELIRWKEYATGYLSDDFKNSHLVGNEKDQNEQIK